MYGDECEIPVKSAITPQSKAWQVKLNLEHKIIFTMRLIKITMIKFSLIRILFLAISTLIMTTAAYTRFSDHLGFSLLLGGSAGALFAGFIFLFDSTLKRTGLRNFNLIIMGLFFGYLFGRALTLILKSSLTPELISPSSYSFMESLIYIVSAYVATQLLTNASEEIHLSIPFIKFNPIQQKKKDIIIDMSVLLDARIIDLTSAGLLDSHLVVPRFLLKELNEQMEHDDESGRLKAKRCLDVLKKIELVPNVEIRYADMDFPEAKDHITKLVRLARLMDAHLMTADMSRIRQSSIEGIKVINLNSLSNALKPLTQTGEFLTIKIQRYGKEARQGVGYLDDGTMVVVNGGAEFIGEAVKAQVLSVKHTSSGRMIFCNATEGEMASEEFAEATQVTPECSQRKYFAL